MGIHAPSFDTRGFFSSVHCMTIILRTTCYAPRFTLYALRFLFSVLLSASLPVV
jgi:hypothetical protein